MNTFEIIITLTFVLGIGYISYLIVKDPVLLLKSLLRGLKNNDNWKTLILFFPIWGPIWVLDRLFGLKIYIKDIEEASRPKHINFNDFEKYILVNTEDREFIEKVIKSFQDDFDPLEYNYSLGGSDIKVSKWGNKIVLKFEQTVSFDSFNVIIQYLDNSAPQNQIYNVKAILLNRHNRADSYFVFYDTAYSLKLVGKSYQNKRMYVDLDPAKVNDQTIYFNSNIENFNNFKFDEFESNMKGLNFETIKIKPSP